MGSDTSREKSLRFLLSNTAQTLIREGYPAESIDQFLKTLVIKDGGDIWQLEFETNGYKQDIYVGKKSFLFYATKSLDNYDLDPAAYNYNSAKKLILDSISLKKQENFVRGDSLESSIWKRDLNVILSIVFVTFSLASILGELYMYIVSLACLIILVKFLPVSSALSKVAVIVLTVIFCLNEPISDVFVATILVGQLLSVMFAHLFARKTSAMLFSFVGYCLLLILTSSIYSYSFIQTVFLAIFALYLICFAILDGIHGPAKARISIAVLLMVLTLFTFATFLSVGVYGIARIICMVALAATTLTCGRSDSFLRFGPAIGLSGGFL